MTVTPPAELAAWLRELAGDSRTELLELGDTERDRLVEAADYISVGAVNLVAAELVRRFRTILERGAAELNTARDREPATLREARGVLELELAELILADTAPEDYEARVAALARALVDVDRVLATTGDPRLAELERVLAGLTDTNAFLNARVVELENAIDGLVDTVTAIDGGYFEPAPMRPLVAKLEHVAAIGGPR